MAFESNISSNVKFTRTDTNKSVEVFYDLKEFPPKKQMQELMQKCITKTANENEKIEFGKLWQERVENISKHISKVIQIS